LNEENINQSSFPRLMELFGRTVGVVSEAIATALEAGLEKRPDDLRDKLRGIFERVFPEPSYHPTGKDPHLVRGLYKRSRGHTTERSPRLVDLVIFHLQEAFDQASERGVARGYILAPSPLLIAIEALTIPEAYHTRAYSLLAARIYLSRKLGVWPRNAFVDQGSSNTQFTIDENTIIEEFDYCRTLVEYGDIWSVKADPKKSFIGHYLAARGVLVLRFRQADAIDFMRRGIFSSQGADPEVSSRELQYRLSHRYTKLPAPADFMNEILGVPLAIRGAEVIFFNGLKPSVNAGLVMQLSGGPGTGKTTLALALAAALASIGTQTLYFSVEEAAADLSSKLRQQLQSRLTALSYYSTDEENWFKAYELTPTSLNAIETSIIEPLAKSIAEEKSNWSTLKSAGAAIPALPFLVVVDSLSALDVEDGGFQEAESAESTERRRVDYRDGNQWLIRRRLSEFVRLCREMRVFVILITGDRGQPSRDLDYLVDMVVHLGVEGSDQHSQKPVRLLTLSKSRQQISRHGTHIFHLSGDSGLRLAPQLSSQMDALQDLRQLLWDRHTYSEVMNVRRASSGGYKYVEFMRIHWRSQILLQGKGSSGKAGLALKIALSPKFSAEGFVSGQDSPRVLVLSFLYPQSYYDTLKQRIEKGILRESKVSNLLGFSKQAAEKFATSIPKLTVIHLTPGFLVAEDLHSKLIRKLEEARLEGRPYSCVIIDGLHNLALQFPGAGESVNLLPIMYGTLARSNVTTITTFTTLALSSSEIGSAGDLAEESVFRLRVHLPLLHTLVQASDYVLEVFRADRARPLADVYDKAALSLRGSSIKAPSTEDRGAAYLVAVQSAISRDPPASLIGWQRQDLEFCDPGWNFGERQQSLPIE